MKYRVLSRAYPNDKNKTFSDDADDTTLYVRTDISARFLVETEKKLQIKYVARLLVFAKEIT